jgi:8-amino-7-oxononanoate synthase
VRTFQEKLDDYSALGRLRSLRTLPQAGSKIEIEGRSFLNFSSNDYLSLSQDERIKRAAAEAVFKWGASASASRLVTGDLDIHAELERELADYLGMESALVFGSGFLTNLGVLTSLAGRNDQIFGDKLNHASLIDGAQQSRADVFRYKHNDMEDLLRLIEENPTTGERVIVTESVFSMDGDIAPLEELSRIANKTDSILVVDEAHALGVFGSGVVTTISERAEKLVIVGTLSKSLGSYGGFVACSRELKSYFINSARSFIYSTGLPPSSCAAALTALKIIRKEKELGAELLNKASFFYSVLSKVCQNLLPFESQIIPIIVNDNEKSVQIAQSLYEKGIICSAIRPPTVPQNSARLRLSVNLAHTKEELSQVADEIGALLRL